MLSWFVKQSAQPVQQGGGCHQHAGDGGSGCDLDGGRKPFGFCINELILGLGRRLDTGWLNRGKRFRSGNLFRLRFRNLGLLDNGGPDIFLKQLRLSGRLRLRFRL